MWARKIQCFGFALGLRDPSRCFGFALAARSGGEAAAVLVKRCANLPQLRALSSRGIQAQVCSCKQKKASAGREA
jgi:hypothetical protein